MQPTGTECAPIQALNFVFARCGMRIIAVWRIFAWAVPLLALLLLAMLLPSSVERALNLPLQRIAAELSCGILQMIGEPALVVGNTIVVGNHCIEVESACSGLRIFVGIAALAYAYVVLVRRCWWEKCLIMIAVVPVALVSNAVRIVVTAYIYQHFSEEAGKKFTHDAAGWVVIVLAATLFGMLLWYLKWLVREYKVVGVGDLIRHNATNRSPTASNRSQGNQDV